MDELGIKIKWIGGNCPVQAEGTIDGKAFYFRARGDSWSVGVGEEPVGDPEWYYEQSYGDGPFDAGWMEESEALDFITDASVLYRVARLETPAHD